MKNINEGEVIAVGSYNINKVFEYIAAGDLENLRKIVKDTGSELDITNNQGLYPIHLASNVNNSEIAAYLINTQGKEIVNLKSKDGTSTTPLILAAKSGRSETAKILTYNGANTETTPKGQINLTPLKIAIYTKNVGLIKVLLKAGAQIPYIHKGPITSSNVYLMTSETTKMMDAIDENPAMQKLLYTALHIKNISSLEATNMDEFVNLGVDVDFCVEMFEACLVKNGLVCNSFADFKVKLKETYPKMPDNIMTSFIAAIERCEDVFIEKMETIEAALIGHYNSITPVPYSSAREEREFNIGKIPDTQDKEASIKAHTDYWSFWNKPENAKYKTLGVYCLEFMNTESASTNIPALVELMLRSRFLNEEGGINPFKNSLDAFCDLQKIPKPQKIHESFNNTFKKFDEFKNNPLMKALLDHTDIIAIQKEEINFLKQTQREQEQQITEIQKWKMIISEKFGLDHHSNLDENTFTATDQLPLSGKGVEDSLEVNYT